MIRFFLVAMILATLTGCSNRRPVLRDAPVEVRDSFATPADPLAQQNGHVVVRKTSLGKAFLMTPSLIVAGSAPSFNLWQASLVMFERAGSRLGLYQINSLTYYQDLPADKILQSFEIVSETETDVVFRWDYGFDFLPMQSLWAMSDLPPEMAGGEEGPFGNSEPVWPVVASQVREMRFEENELYIEQVSRLRNLTFAIGQAEIAQSRPVEVSSTDVTATLGFRLRPYRPTPGFVARESENAKGIGYFEQHSWSRQEHRARLIAQRWDLSPERGPVVYAITSNTPAEFVEPIREGILYWNRVLDREAFAVETGVSPRERPRDRRVLVHWMNWEDAGFARANLQADPLTGELVGGNVFMTSAFVVGGSLMARLEPRWRDPAARWLAPAGFRLPAGCHLEANQGQTLDTVEGVDVSPEMVLKAAQDQVLVTIAHEVGHTVGLRHNFAASLRTELSTETEARKARLEYLRGTRPQGAVVSSSVMDYVGGIDGSLLGAAIRTESLHYDVQAMRWGYEGIAATNLDAGPFCTDGTTLTQVTRLGCERFDSGTNPLEFHAASARRQRDNSASRFGRGLLMTFFPARGPTPSVADLRGLINGISLENRAAQTVGIFGNTLKGSALANVEHFRTLQALGPKGWLNEAEWVRRNDEWLARDWSAVGGLVGVVRATLPFGQDGLQKGWVLRDAQQWLASAEAREGTTLEGVKYRLSDEQFALLSDVVTKFAPLYEGHYSKKLIEHFTLAADAKVAWHHVAAPAQEEGAFADLARAVVLATDGEAKIVLAGVDVMVPNPRHAADVRGRSLRWLSPKNFARPAWGATAREELKASVLERLRLVGAEGETSAALQQSLATKDLDAAGKAWAATELGVLKALEGIAQE